MIDSFGHDLETFFRRWESESLIARHPAKDLPDAAQLRLSEGRYLLRPCGSEIRPAESGLLMGELFELLRVHLPDRIADMKKIEDLFISEAISYKEFILTVLRNRGNELRAMVRKSDTPEDLMTFLAVYAARPFRMQIARYLLNGIDLVDWHCGYCPVCGHWPSLAHISGPETARMLWCLQCDTRWEFKRLQCAFCLSEDQEKLDFISQPDDNTYRLQACTVCKRYIKEIRSSDPMAEVPFDTIYLGSMLLDVIAARENLIQESPLTVRYDDPDGNELLYYRQQDEVNDPCSGRTDDT
jgi:FdhE protein